MRHDKILLGTACRIQLKRANTWSKTKTNPLSNNSCVEDCIWAVRQWHIFSLNIVAFYQHDLVLAHFKLTQSYYLEKFPLPNSTRRSGMSGCFSFQIPCLSTATWDRSRMEQQGTTRLLQGKNDALEAKKSVKFLTWLIRLPPFTPSSPDIKSLCPGGSFGLVPNN